MTNSSLRDSLQHLFGPAYLDRENQLPFVVGYLFLAAFTVEKISPKTEEDVGDRSRIFREAAEILDREIASV